jgi:signal transduction histidine kinase
MLTEAGEGVGEAPTRVSAGALLDAVLSRLDAEPRGRVEVRIDATDLDLWLPPNLVAQALHNLLQNAFEAGTDPTAVVGLGVEAPAPGRVAFVVTDSGRGMSPQQLEHALEPFATTKEGAGHGMGLFFAATVADRLGGSVRLESDEGAGTRARLEIAQDVRTLM